MRLVYLDEAGISNPQQEPYLVVAGIIVHADKQWYALERYLRDMVTDFIPPWLRAGFTFHANQLFAGGGKIFDRDVAERDQMANIAGTREHPRKIRFAWSSVDSLIELNLERLLEPQEPSSDTVSRHRALRGKARFKSSTAR
jgi:hypothetical protein